MMAAEVLDLIARGGAVLWVLVALSVLSLTVIVAKALQLAGLRRGAGRRAAAVAAWGAGDTDGAQAQAAAGSGPADRFLSDGMAGLQAGLSHAALEADLARRGGAEIGALSQGLRLLDLIAMVAPLLGLLGTVLGMIESFRDLEMSEGSANASILAGGIWVALLTTAGGLLVAIPAAVASGLFSARIDGAAQDLELLAGDLLRADHARTGGG